MTPLSPARKAAEDFAVAVENRDEVDARFADLLRTVAVLREQETPAPRADFAADLRMRLMDAADTLLVPVERPAATVTPLRTPATRRQRRLSVAAAAFVVIGGSAGVAAAAENSLPGDPLYPLKRGIETAQISLNASDSGKGQDLLRAASTRLDETKALIEHEKPAADISKSLSAFQDTATDGADLLFVSFQRNGDSEDITRLRTMISSQLSKLDALADVAPSGAEPAFTSARATLADLDQQASVLCSTCGPQAIADAFVKSSAPALTSLFTVPVSRPATSNPGKGASSLAQRAGEIAKNAQDDDPETAGNGESTTVTPLQPGGSLPEVPTKGLGATVSGLTAGVSSLLQGGSLSDTLDTTLDSLTKLLP